MLRLSFRTLSFWEERLYSVGIEQVHFPLSIHVIFLFHFRKERLK